MPRYLRGRKITTPKKPMGGKIRKWLKEGAPLPGAVRPPKGKTYLRGKLVNMPKYKK